MSKHLHQAAAAAAAVSRASLQFGDASSQQAACAPTMPRQIRDLSEDDEPYVEPSRTSHKRKRAPNGAENAASTVDSHNESGTSGISFPFLTDDEPCLTSVLVHTYSAPASLPSSPASSSSAASSSLPSSSSSSSECVAQSSFHCASKHLFSLTDESRDRGSAKIATITVQLRHPSFGHLSAGGPAASRAAASSSRAHSYISSFKIDGRKSFSNAPFKRYYRRGVHAAWFAESLAHASAGHSALVGAGRVLMLLSQKAGRPNGKGFTGLKHDPTSHSPKHPLLCLSSNSVEYTVQVFVNLTAERLQEETFDLRDWTEVEVEVTARFDAGQVSLQSLSVPSHHQSLVGSVPRPLVQAIRRVPAAITIPPVHQLVAAASPRVRPASTTSSATENLSPASELYISDSTSSMDESSSEEGFSTPILEEDASSSQDSCMEADDHQQPHAHFYSAEHALAAEAFGVSLPESSKDEFLAEWEWLDAPIEPLAKCSPVLAAKASPSFDHLALHEMLHTLASPVALTTVDPSTYPSYELPTAEDFELAQPILEERANKRIKLEIEQPQEALFPTHASHDWNSCSPHSQFAQHHLSPMDYAQQIYSF